MRWPTHHLGGAAAWLCCCQAGHHAPATIAIGAITAAAVSPACDIDNLGIWARHKRPRRGEPVRNWLVTRLRLRRTPIRYRVAVAITSLGDHRESPAHSLPVAAATGLAACLPVAVLPAWPLWIALAVAVGLASHILLDGLTRSPVMMFWPAPWLIHLAPRWARCRVGGWGETLWQLILAVALIGLVIRTVNGGLR